MSRRSPRFNNNADNIKPRRSSRIANLKRKRELVLEEENMENILEENIENILEENMEQKEKRKEEQKEEPKEEGEMFVIKNDSNLNNSTTVIDWSEWNAATSVRNYVMDDTFIDFLKYSS